jgi:predicted NBD/HSP70 family sugar kinase
MNEIAPLIAGDASRRDLSRQRVLEALRRDGPLSRAAIGRLTGLSPASVSAITGQFITEGLLHDIGTDPLEASAGPGRPGQRLGFRPARGAIIGLWVGLDRLILHLADFSGETIEARDERLPLAALDAEALVAALADRVARFSAEAGGGMPILGVGVAFQGFVDQRKGEVVWSPVTRCTHVPLVAGLETALGLPVELDNDASAMAFAITQSEPALREGVTACVMLGDGVGLGVFVDGKPLRGVHGGGIEFGHVRFSARGPQCRCGARGCIESFLADYALYRDAMAVSDIGPPAEGRQPSETEMTRLVARAAAGEPALAGLFAEAGRVLAESLTMLIRLFQPDTIVLCGPGMRAWPLIEEALHAALDQRAIPFLARRAGIRALPFRPAFLTEGVIRAALERLDRRLAASS